MFDEEKGVWVCRDCGCEVEQDELHEVHVLGDSRMVCVDCLDNYSFCEICEEYVDQDEAYYVDGVIVCDDCFEDYSNNFFVCECCGERHRYPSEDGHGNQICDSCFERYYGSCDECGGSFHDDELQYDENADETYCESCASRMKRKAIKNYSYKPSPIFKTGNHDSFYSSVDIKELLFGVELEIDKGNNPEDCAYELCESNEDIYCKHDGSLERGVEIVTHPCTLDYHLNSLGWEKICKTSLKHGFKSNDARTCGLHVHVGLFQFGNTWELRDEVAGKLVVLVDRHWDNLVKFSRRNDYQLSRWACRPDVKYFRPATRNSMVELVKRERNNGRYRAVNLENDGTVEFRLFNGSLKTNTVKATLELVSNMCEYAKEKSLGDVLKSQWLDIAKYKEYPELNTYLLERGIASEEQLEAWEMIDKPIRKFNVGDRVVIVNSEGSCVDALRNNIGVEATIINVLDTTSCHEYEIQYDGYRYGAHDSSDGLLRNCYFVYEHNIKRV